MNKLFDTFSNKDNHEINEYNNKTLALAGIFQACVLIKQLAWTGKCEQIPLETAIKSLLQVNSKSVIEIYGNLGNLSLGLKSLIDFLNQTNKIMPGDLEIAKYVFGLLHLEKKLRKRSDLIKIIKSGIERAIIQANLFFLTHDNVMANLAGIYIDTLSTFTFKIQIIGSPLFLTNPNIVNKSRALLLAGIRSAVLWKQLGSSRIQLFFKKKIFLSCANKLYNSLQLPQQV